MTIMSSHPIRRERNREINHSLKIFVQLCLRTETRLVLMENLGRTFLLLTGTPKFTYRVGIRVYFPLRYRISNTSTGSQKCQILIRLSTVLFASYGVRTENMAVAISLKYRWEGQFEMLQFSTKRNAKIENTMSPTCGYIKVILSYLSTSERIDSEFLFLHYLEHFVDYSPRDNCK